MTAGWHDEPNAFQRGMRKLMGVSAISAVVARILPDIDQAVLRTSNGRFSAANLLSGMPIIALTTTGAKSGQPRTVPLIAVPDDDQLILVASNWGRPKRPAWYYNSKANPKVRVALNGSSSDGTVRELTGTEREDAWRKATAVYPPYDLYAERNGGRPIPVLELRPSVKSA